VETNSSENDKRAQTPRGEGDYRASHLQAARSAAAVIDPKDTMQPSIRIWFENLSASRHDGKHPLPTLTRGDHIHGGLRIEVRGRQVPYLGYFGVDDACLDVWVGELAAAAKALQSQGGKHVFDEGEQGQPAFVFEHREGWGLFSIVDSEISGGEGIADWQQVPFQLDEFAVTHAAFRADLFQEVERVCSAVGLDWAERVGLSAKTDM
jgi:hypothetical protein